MQQIRTLLLNSLPNTFIAWVYLADFLHKLLYISESLKILTCHSGFKHILSAVTKIHSIFIQSFLKIYLWKLFWSTFSLVPRLHEIKLTARLAIRSHNLIMKQARCTTDVSIRTVSSMALHVCGNPFRLLLFRFYKIFKILNALLFATFCLPETCCFPQHTTIMSSKSLSLFVSTCIEVSLFPCLVWKD